MNTFSEGDLVEATKGERRVIDRVRKDEDDGTLFVSGVGFLPRDDYTVTVIEKAAPALPTAEGWYTDKSGQPWSLRINGHGEPEWFLSGVYYPPTSVTSAAPFTRLEPVADTAKKVLNRFREVTHASFIGFEDALKQVRAEFGVTS